MPCALSSEHVDGRHSCCSRRWRAVTSSPCARHARISPGVGPVPSRCARSTRVGAPMRAIGRTARQGSSSSCRLDYYAAAKLIGGRGSLSYGSASPHGRNRQARSRFADARRSQLRRGPLARLLVHASSLSRGARIATTPAAAWTARGRCGSGAPARSRRARHEAPRGGRPPAHPRAIPADLLQDRPPVRTGGLVVHDAQYWRCLLAGAPPLAARLGHRRGRHAASPGRVGDPQVQVIPPSSLVREIGSESTQTTSPRSGGLHRATASKDRPPDRSSRSRGSIADRQGGPSCTGGRWLSTLSATVFGRPVRAVRQPVLHASRERIARNDRWHALRAGSGDSWLSGYRTEDYTRHTNQIVAHFGAYASRRRGN